MKNSSIDWRSDLTEQNVLRMCIQVKTFIANEPTKMKQAVWDFNFEEDFLQTSWKIDSPEFETHAAFMAFLELQPTLCNRIIAAYQYDSNGDPIEDSKKMYFEPLWSAFVSWIQYQIFLAESRNELPFEPSKNKKRVKNKKSN